MLEYTNRTAYLCPFFVLLPGLKVTFMYIASIISIIVYHNSMSLCFYFVTHYVQIRIRFFVYVKHISLLTVVMYRLSCLLFAFSVIKRIINEISPTTRYYWIFYCYLIYKEFYFESQRVWIGVQACTDFFTLILSYPCYPSVNILYIVYFFLYVYFIDI